MHERLIFLDTETTGLEISQGHKLIEIACVEMINRRLTGKNLHIFIDPQREIDSDAAKIHGITKERLLQENARPFEEIADEFLNFLNTKDANQNTSLVIHNAPFDLGFLNNELNLAQKPTLENFKVIDSLLLAKKLRPGKKNNLDALCDFYGIDRSKRTHHGALIDTELLAEVYLAMTRKQSNLIDENVAETNNNINGNLKGQNNFTTHDFSQFKSRLILATDEEINAHNENIKNIKNALWNN